MESYRLIPLSGKRGKGKSAIVDADMHEILSQWRWHLHVEGYASRGERRDGKLKSILMHRSIAETPVGMWTDHINHNRLDNRRKNLRACTAQENQCNQSLQVGCSSVFKGVS